MVKVEHSLVIDRPAETVFDALVDFENTPRWQPQVIEEKLILSNSKAKAFSG